ncbi:RidA family protein [Kibdelosporangium philippinense]|uniref:RidA family protein n=1 Tax=Kibdelosporangium philippinense TaxID=211113 RepID=A0ABS8Z5G3_9PSEU|nr:RidA family protein [Kibdelosporangium philippinense]MCE7002259.1 RidA family protein [Kibdelosporangium philippinense]
MNPEPAFEVIGDTERIYGLSGLPFVPAVRVPAGRDLVFLSGVLGGATPDDDASDIRSETHRLFRNMARVLAEAGAEFTDIVSVTKFLVDIERDNSAVVEVMRQYFPVFPTQVFHVIPG